MELWSVIWANMKKKKGSFIGIFILMFIISVAVTSILSAYLSGNERYDIASKAENAPDIINVVFEKDYDKTYEEQLKLQDEVKAVENIKGMRYKRDLTIKGKEFSSSILMFAYEPEIFSNELENGDRMSIPKEGEIYLPKFFKEKYNCTIGDELTFVSEDKECTFTISDFFEDTTYGTSVMGRKRVYINPSDFEEIYDSNNKEFSHISALYTMLKDEYKGQGKVIKDINKATSIQKYGESCTVFAESKQYTFMMPDILSTILLGFSSLLLIILMVVIAQSIASSIEMEYKTYGIFKAMGFSNIQLRIIILIEYVIASIAGMVIGTIVGGFIEDSVGEIILDGTGLFWMGGIKYKECIAVFIAILIIISLFILLFTRKITTISPVRAISFGNAPIHFSSRLNFSLGSLEFVPLSVKLGLKQVVTHMKQSVALVFIICILTFFTVSMYSLGEVLTGDTIEELFNPTGCDLSVYYSVENEGEISNIKSEIEKYTSIEKEFKLTNTYKTVDDNNLVVIVTDNNDNILGKTKEGRAPKYDNEVMTTPIMAEELGKSIGDMITVEDTKGNKKEYMIVGIQQAINDLGRNITMLESGISRLNPDYNLTVKEFRLTDPEKTEEIIESLESIYGKDNYDLSFGNDYKVSKENFDIAKDVHLVTQVVFILSVIIVGIIVVLVCSKNIMKMRSDIGILKSQGFTNGDIKSQLSMEFLIIALIGSIIGVIFNVMFNDRLMYVFFKYVGITEYVTEYNLKIILVPIAAITLFTIAASWIISGKVRNISPKNLIIE